MDFYGDVAILNYHQQEDMINFLFVHLVYVEANDSLSDQQVLVCLSCSITGIDLLKRDVKNPFHCQFLFFTGLIA